MGVDVLQANNGRVAVELALSEQPALILMDMDMPVMTGFGRCRNCAASAT